MPASRSKYPPEHYPSAIVCDAWGRVHRPVRVRRNGAPITQLPSLDLPDCDDTRPDVTSAEQRRHALDLLAASGRFTTTELSTLQALLVDRFTVTEIAERDGCSRQAVIARIVGNSLGHGGILKKVRLLKHATCFTLHVPIPPELN